MLKLTAFHPLQYNNLDSCFSQISKTPQQISQLHALSVKTAALTHPSLSSRLLALYADPKINSLHHARSLFDHIQQPTLFSWNTIIKCYVQNHRSHDALLLFEEMLSGSPFMPDDFTFPTLIKGCGRLCAVKEGKQIHGLILKTGFGLDMFVQSSLVSFYSKCRDIGYARKVFDKMTETDLISWNSLMDGYVKCGKIELALELFDQMPERDAFSWTVLVDGLSKCGKIEYAREVFDRMPNRNLASWNAMINGYMKSGNFNADRHLFDQMEGRDMITWNSMIAGFESNGKYLDAMVLFQTMLNEYFIPNQVTLVSILSSISGLAATSSKGKWVHSYLAKSGYNMDGVLGTSLIEMYCKCGSIESALAVFRTILKKKLGHWTALIVGLGMHGLANKALELFHQMLTVGVEPNAITFVGVLNACNHAGLVSKGRIYFDMMVKEYGVEPSVEHYGCLVDVLCRAGHLEEAKRLIEQMPVKPNKVIWMSLLSGSKNHKNVEIGEYAAQRVIQVAPQTIGCYVLLSNIYAAAGQWDKVSEVREIEELKKIQVAVQ